MLFMFWDKVIKPIFSFANVKNIVEIGVDTGENTRRLLEYCQMYGGEVTAIDPGPRISVDEWTRIYDPHLTILQKLSLDVLPALFDYDAILIDGDHNWYTVYHELKHIENYARTRNRLPLIFLHDTEWPYARRDMYYVPETILDEYRKPYAQKGMIEGTSGLIEVGGLNSTLYNAQEEGGPRNGVLTAVEDFLKECSLPYQFYRLHSNYGLGVITPEDPALAAEMNLILNSSQL